MNILFRIF